MVHTLNNNIKLKIYILASFIRDVELEISKRYTKKQMRCPVHLSVGQELVPAILGSINNNKDLVTSGHRSHAHYLAKGGNLKKMIAEIYGKISGCSKGKGGSMHLTDVKSGFMGSSSIVANNIPVGVGLGLALKLKQKKNISIVYLGDAAVESGTFFESINLSIIKKLPVLFICENNQYSVYTNIKDRQPKNRKIFQMVEKMSIESHFCDGYDVNKSYDLLKKSINKIRKNSAPIFLEFSTYRWLEHCGPYDDIHLNYRSKEELNFWKRKDPIYRLEQNLIKNNKIYKKKIQSIKKKNQHKIRNAFKFAAKSKIPSLKDALSGLYA